MKNATSGSQRNSYNQSTDSSLKKDRAYERDKTIRDEQDYLRMRQGGVPFFACKADRWLCVDNPCETWFEMRILCDVCSGLFLRYKLSVVLGQAWHRDATERAWGCLRSR